MARRNRDVGMEALQKVQAHIFPRRIRIREYFKDFDPLRSGSCTKPQFARALRSIGVVLSDDEVERLASCYLQDYGPRVSPRMPHPQQVGYDAFCNDADQVFVSGSPRNRKSAAQPSLPEFTKFPDDTPQHHVMQLLLRVGSLCKTRGIHLKACFQDFVNAPHHAPVRVTPRMSGKVTIPQFKRQFPFIKDFPESEVDFLVEQYKTESGDINVTQLHNDVNEVMGDSDPAIARNTYEARPETAEWSHKRLDVVDKLQSKIVEKRVRLYEHFQDFDALRKGFCTVGQVKTVFTILNIGNVLDKHEFEQLVARYTREDGMFCYASFVQDVDCAFAVQGLEKDPLMPSRMPDASTTAPARRNYMALSEDQRRQVHDLQERVKQRVRVRRVLLRPVFQDMDKTHSGHVTRNQFVRVMSMLAFELDETSINLLCRVYCDLGNRNEFNYLDFCNKCDPLDEDLAHAAEVARSPRPLEHSPGRYFNLQGGIRHVAMVN